MTKMQKIILATMVLMLLSSLGYGEDWKFVAEDTEGTTYFYDTQSVSRGQDTTTVCLKTILGDKAKESLIKKYPITENSSYTIARVEINCSRNEQRRTSEVFYGSEGNTVGENNRPKQFEVAPPETIFSALAAIVCNEGEGGN